MSSIAFNSIHTKPGLGLIFFYLLLLILPKLSMAESTQTISCAGSQGGKKLIYINYANTGGKICRTAYDDGGGSTREIAWAQNSTKFCTDVAYRLMSKFTRIGWRCSSDMALPNPEYKPVHLKTHKPVKTFKQHRKARTHYIDQAFLESIKK